MPIQGRDLKEYYVFLASPGDVQDERKAVRAFFESFNINTARHWGVRFTVIDWENYSTIGVGRPQELITQQVLEKHRGSLALVIGLMAQRFGMPSGAAESGTEEEFEWALEHWRKHQWPEIKWYFRKIDDFKAPAEPDGIQAALDQWKKVRAFRQRLDQGQPRVFAGEYANSTAFPNYLDRDLRLWLQDPQRPWINSPAQPTVSPADDQTQPFDGPPPSSNWGFSPRDFAYLIAFAAVAVWTWREWDVLANYHPVVPGLTLFLPLLGIAVGEWAPSWQSAKRQRELHSRGLSGKLKAPGYFRLRPYEEGEDLIRADGAHLETLRWIRASTAPLLFLTGQSGSGKSSLLNAAVLPALKEEGWTVVTARSFGDPTEQLVSSMLRPDAVWKEPPPGLSDPRELLEQAAKQTGRLLVALDQFEEFLILHAEESPERKRLAGLLDSLAANPIAGLTVLCVFRSDYKGAYMQSGLPPLAQDGNWREIAAFDINAARQFLASSGLLEQDSPLLERVIEEAAAVEETKGLIRPITLNMFGLILQRYGNKLPEHASPGRLLRAYLEAAIGNPDLRATAPKLLKPMLTDAGTKQPRTLEELHQETNIPEAQARGCLLELEEQGVVRRLDHAGRIWEISHDFVARLLGPILAGWREKLWRRLRSKPPFRSEKTHQQNLNALKFLRPRFGKTKLQHITSEEIEAHLMQRLNTGKRVQFAFGPQLRGKLKPATVHQEFRILRRILNVAVKKRRLAVNPCSGVEFPVAVSATTRKPYYLTASEQERLEAVAPVYLRNIIVIMVEMGLRPYRELTPMRKAQIDLANGIVHLPDSKTVNGIADMPMSDRARESFASQMKESGDSEYLFPTIRTGTEKPHLRNVCKLWNRTLKRAGLPHFSLYELRHTFATRLSAGGVADHFVTQMLRQGESGVFKRYSQAKLGMMREALQKLDRQANERGGSSLTVIAS